jgi:hypothetical protein
MGRDRTLAMAAAAAALGYSGVQVLQNAIAEFCAG